MTTSLSSDVDQFRQVLAAAKNIIILSGAGLSAPSGIPTYRGNANSFWNQPNLVKFSTPHGLKEDPSAMWQFYHRRRVEYFKAEPNNAHKALTLLQLPSIQSRLVPSAVNIPLLVTQNIDGLLLRVTEPPFPAEFQEKAKGQVIELHGSLYKSRCTSCRAVTKTHEFGTSLNCTALDGLDLSNETVHEIPIDKLPKCGGDSWAGSNRYGRCGGLLRPEVVWFGERPPLAGEVARQMSHCDLLLVVGTSSFVHPAAGFATQVRSNGGRIAMFNLEEPNGADEKDFLFLGSCDEILPEVLGLHEDIQKVWN